MMARKWERSDITPALRKWGKKDWDFWVLGNFPFALKLKTVNYLYHRLAWDLGKVLDRGKISKIRKVTTDWRMHWESEWSSVQNNRPGRPVRAANRPISAVKLCYPCGPVYTCIYVEESGVLTHLWQFLRKLTKLNRLRQLQIWRKGFCANN